jgi:hypothetical protein
LAEKIFSMASESPYPLDGGCPCGLVRYRMHREPIIVHACHCTYCQRETGGCFAVNAFIEDDQVTGLLSAYPRPSSEVKAVGTLTPTISGLGGGQTIFRCPECHGAVWSTYAGAGPRFKFVRAGTLDRKDVVVPDVHIYTSTKVPWMVLPEGAKVFEEFYPYKDVWSEEGLMRWMKVKQAEKI